MRCPEITELVAYFCSVWGASCISACDFISDGATFFTQPIPWGRPDLSNQFRFRMFSRGLGNALRYERPLYGMGCVISLERLGNVTSFVKCLGNRLRVS